MVSVMPSGELAMLCRLMDHERYCRHNLPGPALAQHIHNLNAIRQRMTTEPEQRGLYESEVFAVRSEILEARFP